MLEIQSIFVVGAGLMGAGIAQVGIQSGFTVWLNDANEQMLAAGRAGIEKRLASKVAKEKITEAEKNEYLARLHTTMKLEDAADCDLVIEAIYEDFDVKAELFRKLDAICKPETFLMTNTSSISITALAAETKRPEKFMGLHFFSPVPVMRLIELIPGMRTSDETLGMAIAVGEQMGKKRIISRDSAGFIANRMTNLMMNEAARLVYEGIGTIEDIDAAGKIGFSHPMGPLELTDMIGVDVVTSIAEVLRDGLGDQKYAPCPLLCSMVKARFLGKKTGAGFYVYDENGKKIGPNPILQKATSR